MAQRKKSEIEFIQDTFCPQVAVLCSYDAEVVCRKNSLTFVELVQPFAFGFNGEIKISDPSNNLVTIKNLRVEIKDINLMPIQPLIAKKLLDDSVSSVISSQNVIEKHINNGNYNFVANINTPWFESWRELFIKTGNPGDHEFLKHFLSCIFVVSTGHIDPLDQFQKLITQQQQTAQNSNRYPKWFFPNIGNIYRYFVLLHDVGEGEISKAHQIYENLKNIYGSSNCHLLQINSKSKSLNLSSTSVSSISLNNGNSGTSTQQIEFDPWLQYCKFNDLITGASTLDNDSSTSIIQDFKSNELIDHPLSVESNEIDEKDSLLYSSTSKVISNSKRHGQCLALSDHDRIKTFITEYLQRGLVPYAERTIKILNDQIQSKKSILKSFGIPRRIFGSSNSSSTVSVSTSKFSNQQTPIVAVSTSGLNSNNNSLNGNSSNGIVNITSNFVTTNDEFQLRRLADLAFMFRLYDLAYSSYHSCKKEFSNFTSNQPNSEQLLNMNFYLSGALEMTSISNFMQQFSNDFNPSGIPNSPSTSSLSSISSSSNKSYNSQNIEDAIHMLTHTCKSTYFSTRATLLSTEVLKANNSYNSFLKAAYQFINFPSDDNDIRSGLFLEQAAQCYLAQQQPLIRKYAFFMSLAGHRFNQVGQKNHALRVYRHALDIYENRHWYRAQDHIHFVMSRLNYNLKQLNQALYHITEIINKKKHKKKFDFHDFTNETNVLKDFILYSNTVNLETSSKLPTINLPLIDYANIKINLAPANCDLKLGKILAKNDYYTDYIQENSDFLSYKLNELNLEKNDDIQLNDKNYHEKKEIYQKLEESLYISSFRTLPILFKPQLQFLDKHTDNKQMPKVVVNETASIIFEIKNHLKINLILTDITILWKFVDQSTTTSTSSEESSKPFEISNEFESNLDSENIVECSTIKEITLVSLEKYNLRLNFKPLRSHGHLHILGLKYRLGLSSFSSDIKNNGAKDFSTLLAKHLFEIKGPRLNNNTHAMRSIVYDTDNRLNFKIVNKTAQMQIEMDNLPKTMICNQLERVKIFFINLSDEYPIGNIKIASNEIHTSRICFHDPKKSSNSENNKELNLSFEKSEFQFKKENSEEQQHSQNNNFSDFIYSLDNVILKPKEHYELEMWIRAPETEGAKQFYFMFFYEDFSIHNPNQYINTKPSPKRNSASAHNLKYRIARFEFSLKTENAISILNTNIINSQANSNLLANLEISNQHHETNFELIESFSVSDIWKAWPMNSTCDFILKSVLANVPEKGLITKKNKEILSIILKIQAISKQDSLNDKIFVFNSKFKIDGKKDEQKPDNEVFLYFIKSDLKKNLTKVPIKANSLFVNLIWKSKKFDDNKIENVKYGILPIKLINEIDSYSELASDQSRQLKLIYQQSDFNHLTKAFDKFSMDPKDMIIITLSYKTNILHDFTKNDICYLNVNINLVNLSAHNNFDLILIVKNSNIAEIEKNYLWLGPTQKHVHLKSNHSKTVRFKLGFLSNGLFEIGNISNENLLKMNLFEATNNLSSFDSLAEKIDKSNNSNRIGETVNNNNNNNLDHLMESTAISVYLRNEITNKYDLFKRLNSFTICVSS